MGFCAHCGYDVAAHAIGERCPECGRPIKRIARFPPGGATFGIITLTIVVVLPLVLASSSRHATLVYWMLAQGAFGVCAIGTVVQLWRTGLGRHVPSLCLAGLSGIVPSMTLVLFLRVFVIGGSSNVAQMAGESGYDLWHLWYTFALLFFFANPVSVIVAGISIVLPPYRVRFVGAWALPLSALSCAIAATYFTMTHLPDA